ncbi:MAG: hypothetical protein IJ248_01945 [Candidatus Methanomethylophilaceae archaeon]|nr:hypothetical protein [Candidatus Methanomethylophilaceae archaeon]
MDESEMYELTIAKKQKKLLLSLVEVLLAMGVAISGWLIVMAVQNMQDQDPFIMDREYDVTGTMIVEDREVPYTGIITTRYSSETSEFSVKTYHVKYGSTIFDRTFKYSLMFDADRVPTSRFTHIGSEGGYELWKGTDGGADVVYYLDDKSIVHHMEIEYEGSKLSAEMRV